MYPCFIAVIKYGYEFYLLLRHERIASFITIHTQDYMQESTKMRNIRTRLKTKTC